MLKIRYSVIVVFNDDCQLQCDTTFNVNTIQIFDKIHIHNIIIVVIGLREQFHGSCNKNDFTILCMKRKSIFRTYVFANYFISDCTIIYIGKNTTTFVRVVYTQNTTIIL